MSDRPEKRSITLQGHRTSVSLEREFWEALQEIAAAEDRSVASLVTEIDNRRATDSGLATALRLHVLRHFRNKSA